MTANLYAARWAACFLVLSMVGCSLFEDDPEVKSSTPTADASTGVDSSAPAKSACKTDSDCMTSCGAPSTCGTDGVCHVQKNAQGQELGPEPASAQCDDKNECTIGDHCDGTGNCVGAAANKCSDLNNCTDDSCDKLTGCIHKNRGAGADCGGNGESAGDGDATTVNDKCVFTDAAITQVACRGTPSGACDKDSDCNAALLGKFPCSFYSCKKVAGTTGKCELQQLIGRDDNNDCTVDTCADNGSQWIHEVALLGAVCDDGDFCTEGTTCIGAECKSGQKKLCADDKPCTTDTCDSTEKSCKHDTGDCDDKKPDTLDACTATGCSHSDIKVFVGCWLPLTGLINSTGYDCQVVIITKELSQFGPGTVSKASPVSVMFGYNNFLKLLADTPDKQIRLNVLAVSKVDNTLIYVISGENVYLNIGPVGNDAKLMKVELKLLGPSLWSDSNDYGITLDDVPAYSDPTKK